MFTTCEAWSPVHKWKAGDRDVGEKRKRSWKAGNPPVPLEPQPLLTFSFTIEWTVIQQGWLKVDLLIQMAVACCTSGNPFSSPLNTAFLPCAVSLQTNHAQVPEPASALCSAEAVPSAVQTLSSDACSSVSPAFPRLNWWCERTDCTSFVS